MTEPFKCKCPFKHHVDVNKTAPPATGSETYPDVNAFNDVVKKVPITEEDQYAIDLFKEMLRIPSITGDGPNGPSAQCIQFYASVCDMYGIPWKTLEFTPGYPIFLATVPGKDDSKPSILLNSHFDVVPLVQERWTYPAFDAIELENGDIVARGAQDMKCVCIHHLVGLIRVLRDAARTQLGIEVALDTKDDPNKKLLGTSKLLSRTIHLASMPDEELGGPKGMVKWSTSSEFDSLNVGFALDEGLASEKREVISFYGERTVWWLEIHAKGMGVILLT